MLINDSVRSIFILFIAVTSTITYSLHANPESQRNCDCIHVGKYLQGPDCGVGKLGICSTSPGGLTYKAFLYYLFINYVAEEDAAMFRFEQGEGKGVDVNPLWSHFYLKNRNP